MTKKTSSKIAAIMLAIIGLTLAAATYGAITVSTSFSSEGTITTSAGIGAFYDAPCTNEVSAIDWGPVSLGSSVSTTIYIKNTGSVALILSMSSINWSPANANDYMSISWNRGGSIISPGQSVPATLTLSASSIIPDITSFSVQINILGTT